MVRGALNQQMKSISLQITAAGVSYDVAVCRIVFFEVWFSFIKLQSTSVSGNTCSTTHNVSRQSAMTSVENCVMTVSKPSTMLPMTGCRTWVRSVDDRCEQYSDTARTAEI